jgi:hypothetical protein
MNNLQQLTSSPKAKALLCFCLALVFSVASLPAFLQLDSRADAYFKQAIVQAGMAYASVRLINASVSVIKESNLQIQPAGVGVSLAVGQVLDPLDDLAERVSDVLVMSIAALGLQKLFYELSLWLGSKLMVALLVLLGMSFLASSSRFILIRRGLFKLLLLTLVLRLFLPVSAVVNSYVEDGFFQPRIQSAQQALVIKSIPENSFVMPQSASGWGLVGSARQYVEEKSAQLSRVFDELLSNASLIIESLLVLMYLYITLFIVQIILLPLALFYILYRCSLLCFEAEK